MTTTGSIIASFLKAVAAKLLFSKISGQAVGIATKNMITAANGIFVDTNSRLVSPSVKAMIFWQCYERAEIDAVRRYLSNQYDVVELGGSIGVMSCVIGKRITGRKLVVVEADPELCKLIERNLSLNGIGNHKVIAAAIAAENGTISFSRGRSSTHGSTVSSRDGGFEVPARTLSSILADEEMSDFALVCDIEGAEIDLLLSDPKSLDRCKLIIVETHSVYRDGKEYTFETIAQMFTELGFDCIESNVNNYVLRRNEVI